MTGSAVSGLVLAGGRGSRLGADKALIRLGRTTLVERALARLAPQVSTTAISANGDRARLSMCPVPVLADTIPGFRGPLAGILAGLEWMATETGASFIASVAVDTPFFPLDLVQRLAEAAKAHRGRIAVAHSRQRLHPVFSLWPAGLRDPLALHLADERNGRVMDFIEARGFVAVDFGDDAVTGLDPFFNINTPEDLSAAAEVVAGSGR
jgi:molybdopterin-guanine dinucleotide biosynthesis protein A